MKPFVRVDKESSGGKEESRSDYKSSHSFVFIRACGEERERKGRGDHASLNTVDRIIEMQ